MSRIKESVLKAANCIAVCNSNVLFFDTDAKKERLKEILSFIGSASIEAGVLSGTEKIISDTHITIGEATWGGFGHTLNASRLANDQNMHKLSADLMNAAIAYSELLSGIMGYSSPEEFMQNFGSQWRKEWEC
jgi:hypothetical protein